MISTANYSLYQNAGIDSAYRIRLIEKTEMKEEMVQFVKRFNNDAIVQENTRENKMI